VPADIEYTSLGGLLGFGESFATGVLVCPVAMTGNPFYGNAALLMADIAIWSQHRERGLFSR